MRAIAFAILVFSVAANAATGKEKVTTGERWRIESSGGRVEAILLATGRHIVVFESRKSKPGETDSQNKYELTSVVGTVLTFSHSWYSEGGAHPSYGKSYDTVDLSKILNPAKPYLGDPSYRRLPAADLRDMFRDKALFAALILDANIRQAIQESAKAGQPAPSDLSGLLRVDGGCRMTMGTALVSDFRFAYLLDGRIAAIKIGLGHGCEVMRGNFTELATIHLPVPENRLQTFRKAVADGTLKGRSLHKASFDCRKAATSLEYSICADANLAKLDLALARRYAELRKSLKSQARERVKTGQRAWMKKRNSECASGAVRCLTKAYERRLAVLVKTKQ